MIIFYSVLALIAAYILLLCISSLFVDTEKEYTKDSRYFRRLLNSATGIMIFLLRIKVKLTGMEKLPEGNFLLVSNHRSNFDPILTWYALRKRKLAFVSKAENFRIPVFGRIIRRCCFMAIDREDPRKALVTINKAAALISSGEASVGIYPEGTRSKECVLLPFHAGVFKIAQKAAVPIVVMTVAGTEAIHRNTPFRRTTVSIDILEVIPADRASAERSAVISEEVRRCMENALKTIEKSSEND